MKTIRIFLLIFFLGFIANAQEKKTMVRTTRSGDLEGKVFNKITGEVITNMQLMGLLKEKPGLKMESFYDKYGDLEKSLYDPNNPCKDYSKDPNKRPKIGESFPEFVFKTIDEEEFSSEDLKGNWVLIHFYPITRFINKERWKKLSLDLQKARESFEIVCFGVFAYDDDLIEPVGEFKQEIRLVNNGNGFYSKYHIIEIPTTVLINPEGIIVKYFYESDPIDFLSFLKDTSSDN
jgi:hypothetical protein